MSVVWTDLCTYTYAHTFPDLLIVDIAIAESVLPP